MLRLSDNTNLREQLGWTHDRNLFTETTCHGPAALLSADTRNRLIYQKYQIVAFPAETNKHQWLDICPDPCRGALKKS